jgi:hypothetical protein
MRSRERAVAARNSSDLPAHLLLNPGAGPMIGKTVARSVPALVAFKGVPTRVDRYRSAKLENDPEISYFKG